MITIKIIIFQIKSTNFSYLTEKSRVAVIRKNSWRWEREATRATRSGQNGEDALRGGVGSQNSRRGINRT